MKKKTHTPATALFTRSFEPAPELLPELDELLRLNASERVAKYRVGPLRLSQWFKDQHGVEVTREQTAGWMRRRAAQIGLK